MIHYFLKNQRDLVSLLHKIPGIRAFAILLLVYSGYQMQPANCLVQKKLQFLKLQKAVQISINEFNLDYRRISGS